jgi:hypothetical protein
LARKALSLILALGVCAWPVMLRAEAATDPEIVKGIKAVDDGDFDMAILTLDNAARRLAGDPARRNDLSQAYLYLGIAYVGKGHEAAAKAKFREALSRIKDLTLSPDKFPPKVINVFEAAKEEQSKAPVPVSAEKKGGSKKGLLIGAGVVAVGGGVALAAKGGGAKTPSDPRRVETFTGSLCGYGYAIERGGCDNYRGYDIVVGAGGTLDATISWSDTTALFTISLSDQNYADVAVSNRITNTSSQLTANVSPQTACATCAYHLNIGRSDDGGPNAFTLTVKHP